LGNLRIGATGPYYILRSVAAFRQRYPAIEISIQIGNSRQMIDALYEYRIDAAVSSHALGDDRLHRVMLAADPMVLVTHPAHPLARRPHVDVAELAGCHLLVREQGSMTREATESALRAVGAELPGAHRDRQPRGDLRGHPPQPRRKRDADGEVPRDPALTVVRSPTRAGDPRIPVLPQQPAQHAAAQRAAGQPGDCRAAAGRREAPPPAPILN
jgi:DNA-binding transcriptional LysR family regulator